MGYRIKLDSRSQHLTFVLSILVNFSQQLGLGPNPSAEAQ
jgi:hypothetical protein